MTDLGYDDSDEATGCPPLNEPERDMGVLLTSYDLTQEGLVAHPKGETPVIFLSVRGLVKDDRTETGVGWAQVYIGIPLDRVEDIIFDLWNYAPVPYSPPDPTG